MARREKQYHYIYKTTCIVNGKYYIGMHSTDNLEDGYMGSGKRLRRSLNKHGKENFKFEILEFLPDRVSLKEREKELVNEELIKDSLSMNIKVGGEGGFVDEEHKIKFLISSQIGRNLGIEKIRFLSKNEDWVLNRNLKIKEGLKKSNFNHNTFLNKQHSEETKKKMSKIRSQQSKGEGNSQFGTCWITNGKENKKIKKEEIIPDGWELGRKK